MSRYYVHYNLHNYILHGTEFITSNEDGQKTEQDLHKIFKIHKDIKNRYVNNFKKNEDKMRVEDMENFYRELLFSKTPNKEMKQLRDSYIEASQKILIEKFKNPGVISSQNLLKASEVNGDISQYQTLLKEKVSTGVRKMAENNSNYRKTYLDRISQIRSILNMTNRDNEFKNLLESTAKANNIASDIKELRENLRKIVRTINKKNINLLNRENTMVTVKINGQAKKISTFDYLTQVIDAIGTVPYWGTQSNQNGILGEIAAAMYQYIGQKTSEDIVVDIVSSFQDSDSKTFKGVQKSKASYDSPFSISSKKNNSKIEIKGSHTSKIDVIISQDSKKEDLKLSVKNYKSLTGFLTLVDNTPLATLLKSLDVYGTLEGHFANLIAEHQINNNKINNNNIGKYLNYKKQMQKLISEQALINAFEGYDKSSKPNIFVVFGNNKNEVRVYNMEILIGGIFESLNKNNSMYKLKLNKKDMGIEENLNSLKDLVVTGTDGKNMTSNAEKLFKQHKLHVMTKIL